MPRRHARDLAPPEEHADHGPAPVADGHLDRGRTGPGHDAHGPDLPRHARGPPGRDLVHRCDPQVGAVLPEGLAIELVDGLGEPLHHLPQGHADLLELLGLHRRASGVASCRPMPTPTRTPRAPAGAASGPKAPGPQRSRTMQLVVIAVAAGLLVMAVVIFFLARSDDGGSSGPIKKSASGNVQLTLAGVQNANAGVPATFGD